MMQTLYRIATPEQLIQSDSPLAYSNVEYMQLSLDWAEDDAKRCVFKVFHGWWNQAEGKPIHPRAVLEHSYELWEEGEATYNAQLGFYVSDGFSHSFTRDPFAEDQKSYTKLS